VKRLLAIAYHFPPLAGSSGIQRTLRFVQQLPQFGWEALVLTCHPRAYEQVKADLLNDIPEGTVVERAFACDTARHLSIRGRYPQWLARPDRWVSWWPSAVITGRRMLRNYKPHAIFSTYPIATAHLIGNSLARVSQLPWVADFRDPMAQEGYPPDPRTWTSFKRVEDSVFGRAAACTFTTEGAANMYRRRYPGSAARIEIIENGYDEAAFAGVLAREECSLPLNAGAKTILHSGIVYPQERDPTQLIAALALLKARDIDGTRLRVRFRAALHDDLLRMLVARHGVPDMVEILPHLPYRDALREMLRADGLLVMQAANCNDQVPAKLYEYLRARRPVLAATDPGGDTARVLRAAGVDAIASLENAEGIATLLERFVRDDRWGMLADERAIAGASRLHRTEQLAALLDQLSNRPPA
jgi:glycosyltransferase involved in cell wall biosynthesis